MYDIYFFHDLFHGSSYCTTLLLVSAASGKRSSFSGPHQPRVDVPILTASTKSEKSQDGKQDIIKNIPQSDRKSRYVTNAPFCAPISESCALKADTFLLSPPGTKVFRAIDAHLCDFFPCMYTNCTWKLRRFWESPSFSSLITKC